MLLAFAYANLPHVLCALLLIARLGDIGTTYLATPRLRLEANPIVRKLGWPFALLSLGACFLPYYSITIAVPVLIGSRFWFRHLMPGRFGSLGRLARMLTRHSSSTSRVRASSLMPFSPSPHLRSSLLWPAGQSCCSTQHQGLGDFGLEAACCSMLLPCGSTDRSR